MSLLALSLLAVGCDEKGGKSSKPAEAAAPAAAAAAPAAAPLPGGAPAWKTLDKLGAKVEVPGNVAVHDSSGEGMPPSYSLYSDTENSEFNVMITATSDLDPSSLDAAKRMLAMDPNKVKKYTREEKTKDGWVLNWEAESMMDQKPLYGVQVRKTVAGKGITCERNVEAKSIADAITKACLTLASAK